MSKIEEALWNDYEAVNDLLGGLEINSKEYEDASKERDNIRNELIKLNQTVSENKRDKIRNIISIVTFTVSTVVSVYAISKTFKFDQEATVTSTLGRGILNGVVPKMLKR